MNTTLCLTSLLVGTVLVAGALDAARARAAPAERTAVREATLVEQLDWLGGRWFLDEPGKYVEETWGPAREDALVGSLRWARGGSVWLYELMSIEADEQHGLVFRLRHFDRGLVPWKSEADGPLTYPLADLTAERVVFENTERDSPRRFVYERDGDRLTVLLQGPDDVATGGGQRFVFGRER